ncbi:unclassified [Brachyspira pilosicoli WesB]|uniref:Unclassified n=2 Tax=Brachyspira pilosicoli TaxID=52584 RepID=K0JH44_BRAPL|nr:unclassified [Brachyspira pilosicoli WesB]SUW04289.1 unclassified [Brachyspira pilosicoli]SUW07954.1 unclassified [Brachyspira pilosicoli]
MILLSKLVSIFTNKNTYIVILLIIVISFVIFFFGKMNSYKNKIIKLENTIEYLEITNRVLHKEYIIQQDKIKLLSTYSNSTKIIDNLNKKQLNKEHRYAIDNVSNDFYNYFNILSNN